MPEGDSVHKLASALRSRLAGKHVTALSVEGVTLRDWPGSVIAEVFAKKAQATSKKVIDICKGRYKDYDDACK